jgi:hypothetical protein
MPNTDGGKIRGSGFVWEWSFAGVGNLIRNGLGPVPHPNGYLSLSNVLQKMAEHRQARALGEVLDLMRKQVDIRLRYERFASMARAWFMLAALFAAPSHFYPEAIPFLATSVILVALGASTYFPCVRARRLALGYAWEINHIYHAAETAVRDLAARPGYARELYSDDRRALRQLAAHNPQFRPVAEMLIQGND